VRKVEQVGPFLATFHPDTDHPFLNYAIPDDGSAPTEAEVAALAVAYRDRGRVPRLEYLPAVAPAVEAALVAGGFVVESRLALMACPPGAAPDLAPPPGIEIVLPESDGDLLAMIGVQHQAFGDEPPEPAEVARLQERLAAGAVAASARDTASGATIGAAEYTPPQDGAAELVGIAVAEPYRGRGIAGVLTARLTREAFDRGLTTVFLSPGDEAAGRVYTRAGYRITGTILHIRHPTDPT
jgi:ribosomal protein S18 acetylase RimI-like enzyme